MFVAAVEFRYDLSLEESVEGFGFRRIPGRIVTVFEAVADGPAHLGRICLRPPAIEFREVHPAIDKHLHAAGAAGFPRTSWRVHPEIDALNKLFRHQHIVITEEDNAGSRFRATGKLDPLPNHVLPFEVLRMGLSGKHELDRMFVIRQDAKEAVRIMQEKVGSLVRRKTPGETKRQSIRIKN